jgi:FdhD protein
MTKPYIGIATDSMDTALFVKDVVIEKVSLDDYEITQDYVINEDKVDFFLNGNKLLSVMTLAYMQDAHFVGFLLSEGILESKDELIDVSVSQNGTRVDVVANIKEENLKNLFKEKTLTSGCCVGVTGNADDSFSCAYINSKYKIELKNLLNQMRDFAKSSELFDMTGCVHKARLVLSDTVYETQDIGRHNAIDKVAGKAFLDNNECSDGVLYVSGRLSKEMVVKCVMHKIPIVVSKSAVTIEGIKSAQEHGITLVGFARGNKINIYSHSSRIVR